MKRTILFILGLACVTLAVSAFAADGTTDIGSVAAKVTSNFKNIGKLLTATAFIAGFAITILGIFKIKAHKENATQIPASTGIVFIFVGAALIFLPQIFSVAGSTLFGEGAKSGSASGVLFDSKEGGGA
jgi:intracellular multiplication protein IcmD